jgi:hypothetical protein
VLLLFYPINLQRKTKPGQSLVVLLKQDNPQLFPTRISSCLLVLKKKEVKLAYYQYNAGG